MFAFYLPASLIVRTEPQSEIGRNRGKKSLRFCMSHGTTKTKQMFLFLTCMLHDFPKEMCVAGGTDVFLSFLFCTSPDDASLKGGREHRDLISFFWHV